MVGCLESSKESNRGTGELELESERVADERQPNPAEQVAKRDMAQMAIARLEELPEAQRKVLQLYYFDDLRLREIGEQFGVTESRVSQLHAQAIEGLRNYLVRRDSAF